MRSRPLTLLAFAALSASFVGGASLPGGAEAAKKKKVKRPTITRVTPMRIKVGATLTIRGKNFSSKRTRNTVIFRAPNGRSAFAKPRRASKTKLVVRVPAASAKLLSNKPTRFKLRVLAGKFSSFTSKRLSPVLVPSTSGSKVGGGGGTGKSSCVSGDFDGDLLAGSLEAMIKTDPCLRDTDLDGVEDGYEYQSARDLNDDEYQPPLNGVLPYPGKRPYPNALDSSDGNIDFDGDVLTLGEEYFLWSYTISRGGPRQLFPLSYSDGEQTSLVNRDGNGKRQPTQPTGSYGKASEFRLWALGARYYRVDHYLGNVSIFDFDLEGTETLNYYDFDGDGYVADDERDEDADGLTNYDETHGRATPGYWQGCYAQEKPYYVQYAGTSYLDPDSDGDGIRDGADDQDHDDVPNVMELSRNAASNLTDWADSTCKPADGLPSPPDTHHPSAYGRVNPFNPCLPNRASRTCQRHPSLSGGGGAPFDGSPNWYSLN